MSDTNPSGGSEAAASKPEDRSTLHVAVATSDDHVCNAVVVAGFDLEFPLEADLDGDPLHDDVLRMEGVDGSISEAAGFRLDTERRLLLHRFEGVLPGIYAVSVMLSDGRWAPVLSNIVVTKDGAAVAGVLLKEAQAPALAADDQGEPEESDADDDDV